MNSIQDILNMIATEAASADTHQCHSCRRTFEPNEDGCPYCGVNAPVSLIPELQTIKHKEGEKHVPMD